MKRALLATVLLALSGCPRHGDPVPPIDASASAAAEASVAAVAVTAGGAADASAVPDVVSSASAAWDGGPAVVPSGEVDGDALRRSARARIAADRSAVTVLSGTSARELGERLCQTVVPKRPKETPVLVKPNIGGFEYFKDPEKNGGDDGVRGRTTDPEFVRGIIRCLKARGHAQITIAEGFGHDHKAWVRLAKVSGYGAMAKEENVRLVALDDDGVFDVEDDQPGKPLAIRGMEKTHAPTLLMPKILAEHLQHGLFISAPKVKAHRFSVTSMAIKGGQGVVMLSDARPAFNQKWRMHKELSAALKLLSTDKAAGRAAYLDSLHVFAERMADVLEVAAPHVVLAEAAPAMGGNGFDKRWPSAEQVAIGGTNPILVDRVGAQLLGLWDNADLARELGGHRTSPLLSTAAKRFGVDLTDVKVEGDGAGLIAGRRPVHFVSMSGFSLLSDDKPPEGAVAAPAELVAKRLDDVIKVDGVVDAAWSAARPARFETDWAGKKTGTATRVRAAAGKDALYMLWELEGAGVNVDATRPVKVEREKLYEEDCVEVFLTPNPADRTRYYEVEVGPLGHFFDLAVDRKTRKSDVAWSSAPEIATKVDRDRKMVTIELALRAPELASALKPGARLPLGLYRMEGASPRQYLAWSPTRTDKPNFHVPEAFGTLVIE
jgi:uncharacterized protein (DUF362 family)